MARGFWGATVAAYVAVLVWAWHVLPEENVVQHIGPDGPNSWGSRAEHLGAMAAMTLLTVGITPVIAWAAGRGDGAFVNIPNKGYWFAPEHRAETQAAVQEQLWWFLGATNLLLVVSEVEIVRVTAGRASFGWWPFVAYLVFTAVWMWRLHQRFRRPEQ